MDHPHAHAHREHVAARFEHGTDADEALHELEQLQLGRRLQIDVHHAGDDELNAAERRLFGAIGGGMLLGAVMGVLMGLGAMALWASIDPSISRGEVLAVGIGPGGILGLLVGGITGIALRSRFVERARAVGRLHLADDEEIVLATVNRQHVSEPDGASDVGRVLADHHGRLIHVDF